MQENLQPEEALFVITFYISTPTGRGGDIVYVARVPEPLSEYLKAELE